MLFLLFLLFRPKLGGDAGANRCIARRASHFESKKHKLCSVNAKAAFELGSFRLLFESCTFHSPTLLSRTLGANGDNPKWTELKCDEINITSYSSH